MHTDVGSPQVGQWYRREDKGETFQVTAYDDEARTIEIQTFDGEIDEIDAEVWRMLPLSLAEPPEDCTGPLDDVEVDDLGYSETDMTAADWTQPLEPFRPPNESWQDTSPEGDAESAPEDVALEPRVAPRVR